MLQTITIELDIPDGHEFVAYRSRKKGDLWLSSLGRVETAENDSPVGRQNFILRKTWVAPEWINPGWLVYGLLSQKWIWFKEKPSISNDGIWYNLFDFTYIENLLHNWTPPEWHDEPIPVHQGKTE